LCGVPSSQLEFSGERSVAEPTDDCIDDFYDILRGESTAAIGVNAAPAGGNEYVLKKVPSIVYTEPPPDFSSPRLSRLDLERCTSN
jgi:hypothetical protein